MVLSDRAHSVWAKSSRGDFGRPAMWLPLPLHLADAMGVAERCAREWFSDQQWRAFERPLGIDDPALARDVALSVIRFTAGVHDIGKAAPTFSVKVPDLDAVMEAAGLTHGVVERDDIRSKKHGLVGAVVLKEYLGTRAWKPWAASSIASVVGGHHGVPPSLAELSNVQRERFVLGDSAWVDVRRELLDWMWERSGIGAFGELLAKVKWTQSALVLLEGVVIMADWIASNERYFPLFSLSSPTPRSLIEDSEAHSRRVDLGWSGVGISATWQPTPLADDADEALRRRFALDALATARPLQKAAIEAARTMDVPGILIIEDVMGAGKTEAGLLAAEILAQRGGASGIMMVLPTQATTDAMFDRVKTWVERGEDAEGTHHGGSMALMHGKAALNASYAELSFRGGHGYRPLLFDDEGSHVDAHERVTSDGSATRSPWMSGKKTILSDVVVATIDQFLMVALKARYLALRHLGVSRKVVVLDEVHAADVYMRRYLKQALTWCASYGVPVVALSATLPPSVRQELMDAYQEGIKAPEKSRIAPPKASIETGSPVLYPLLSSFTGGEATFKTCAQAFASREVQIRHISREDILPTTRGLLQEGGCLLIVRNTVKEAQRTYRLLKQEYGDDVHLVHARFVAQDRLDNDDWLLASFGKPSPEVERPQQAIVVATQVVEQSLDIDFDAIITDLAPVDLLFQRIGRVHRHEGRERPSPMRQAQCFVLDVPQINSASPEEAASTKGYIYSSALLLRTAWLLRNLPRPFLRIPDDIAPMTAQIYDHTGALSSQWREAEERAIEKDEAETNKRVQAANVFRLRSPHEGRHGLMGWLDANSGDDNCETQARARVRDGDDSLEVIVVVDEGSEGVPIWRTLEWVEPAPGDYLPLEEIPREEVVDTLMRSMVRLPPSCSRDSVIETVLRELWFHPEAWQREPLLAGQLILPLVDGEILLAGKKLRYSTEYGLEEVEGD